MNIRTIQRVESDGAASLETTMALAAAFDLEIKELFANPEMEKKNSNKTLYIVLSLIAGFVLGLLF